MPNIKKIKDVSRELEDKILADFDNSSKTPISDIALNNNTTVHIVKTIIKENNRRRLRPTEAIHKDFMDSLEEKAKEYWRGKNVPENNFSRLVIPLVGARQCANVMTAGIVFKKYPGLRVYMKSYFGGM